MPWELSRPVITMFRSDVLSPRVLKEIQLHEIVFFTLPDRIDAGGTRIFAGFRACPC